jgi:hypothetical protein
MGKGTGYRLFHDHFAELAHDQEGDNPGDAITQQHGWPGHLYSGSDTEEKPGPDSAPEGDKLNMTVLQTAMQRRILFRRGFSSTIA